MKLFQIVGLTLLFMSTSVFAGEYKNSQLNGSWIGQFGDYESSYDFNKNGDYTSVVEVFGMQMISKGKWSIENGSIKLEQKESIAPPKKKEKSGQTFIREITLLSKNKLETLHNDALGDKVISKYVRK